jgi:hypothetical protein
MPISSPPGQVAGFRSSDTLNPARGQASQNTAILSLLSGDCLFQLSRPVTDGHERVLPLQYSTSVVQSEELNWSARETGSAEIRYPAGVFSLTAVLQEDNTWKIEPTSKSNATKLKRVITDRRSVLVGSRN